jgi:O-antigen ligase
MVVLWRRSRRMAITAQLVLLAGLAIMVATVPPLRARFTIAVNVMKNKGDGLNILLSNRVPAWRAGAQMFADHPLLGTGPGTFHYHYLEYRIGDLDRYPNRLYARIWNFGETHNDHLQIAAETGLPGYLIFIAALALVASCSLASNRSAEPSATERFAGVFGLPYAVLVFTVAIAQFPLQVAATSTLYLYLAAITVAWRYPLRSERASSNSGGGANDVLPSAFATTT